MQLRNSRYFIAAAVMAAAIAPAAAETQFDRIVVFGTSLSDSGNAFALRGNTPVPPDYLVDPFLVPSAPYARGGHHFSNGATWVEQFARPLGLAGSVKPAFMSSSTGAANYAVGGARAHDDGVNLNLPAQVEAFLQDSGGVASASGLYVIEMAATTSVTRSSPLQVEKTALPSFSRPSHRSPRHSDTVRRGCEDVSRLAPSQRRPDAGDPHAGSGQTRRGAAGHEHHAGLQRRTRRSTGAALRAAWDHNCAARRIWAAERSLVTPRGVRPDERHVRLHHARHFTVHVRQPRRVLVLGWHSPEQGRARHYGAGCRICADALKTIVECEGSSQSDIYAI